MEFTSKMGATKHDLYDSEIGSPFALPGKLSSQGISMRKRWIFYFFMLLQQDCAVFPTSGQKYTRPCNGNGTLTFSGIRWQTVMHPRLHGPGPNYFSGSRQNVWLDKLGRLHLRMGFHEGKWRAADVYTCVNEPFFEVEVAVDSPLQSLDPNVVVGFF